MKCLTYARVSTLDQAERELSLPAQQQAMRDYAERQGWSVVGEFVERGVSAKTTQRPELQRLLTRCRQEPRVDTVLVHKIDRLARNVADHVALRAFLKQQNVRLASVVENVDDSIPGQLVENIMASFAQFYSQNLAGEVKKGMQQLVRNGGWPHLPPRGYKIVREQGARNRIVLSELAPAMRRAFETYATGMHSVLAVRDQLAAEGVRAGNGRPLDGEYLRQMLKNPFYAGRVRWGELEYPGNHEPLIPIALFQRVQEVLELRHRDYGGEVGRLHFWLRGVLRCDQCGRKLTAERHDRWHYYRCVSNTIKNRLCSAPFVPAHTAEPAVLSLLNRLHVSPELKRQLQLSAQEHVKSSSKSQKFAIESLRVRKAKLEIQENRLTEAFMEGAVSTAAYRTTVDKVRAQLFNLDKQIAETRHNPGRLLPKLEELLRVSQTLGTLHSRLPPRTQTQFLKVVFKEIVVTRNSLVSYALNQPFDGLLVDGTEDSNGDTPTGHTRAPHLDKKRITSTIREVLEFDETALRQILELSTNTKAA